MVKRRAGPEDAHLLVHLLVGDAVVVGDAAPRSDAQFLENFARLVEREILPPAQPSRQIA